MSLRFEDVLVRDGKLIYTGTGYSMLPMLRPKRDLIIVERPKGRLKRYDVALYRRDGGQYVLHRVLGRREDGYILCGDHQWQREYAVTDRQIIGVLTAFVRDGKEIPVTDPRYRLYVHLWCDLFWLRAAILWCLALFGRIKRKRTRRHNKTPGSGERSISSVQNINHINQGILTERRKDP